MSGLPDIDVEDWERNTEYSFGYDENSDIIKVCFMFDWFNCVPVVNISIF